MDRVQSDNSRIPSRARRWTRRRLFVLAAVINVLLARAFWPVGRTTPTHSREITYLTGPVNPDGTVNYAVALDAQLAEGVTPETNALIEFVRVFGPSSLVGDNAADTLAKLGLDDLPADGEYPQSLISFIRRWVNANPTPEEQSLPQHTERSRAMEELAKKLMRDGHASTGDWSHLEGGRTRRRARSDRATGIYKRVTEAPWAEEEFPFVAEHLAERADDLARLVKLSRLVHWYVPIVSARSPEWLSDRVVASIRVLRGATDLLRARAMLSLDAVDIDAAWEDAQACHRLARLVATDVTLIPLMIGVSIEDVALGIDAQICAHAKLGAERARRYGDVLAGMAPLRSVVEVLDRGERCGTLDIAAATYRSKDVVLDHDLMVRRINGYFDRLVTAARLPPLTGRKAYDAVLDEFSAQRDELTAAYKGWAGKVRVLLLSSWQRREFASVALSDVAMSIHMPAYTCVEGYVEMQTRRSLVRAAFALAAYRSDNGWLAPDAEALVPKYLAAWPTDPFAGRPASWRYDAGELAIYSVGRDGADDNGDPEKDVVVTVR